MSSAIFTNCHACAKGTHRTGTAESKQCNRKFVKCDPKFLSCDRKLLSCDHKLLSCDRKLLSCHRKLVSCDRKLVSCDRKLVSCDRKLVSCGGKNRCVPYEPPYFQAPKVGQLFGPVSLGTPFAKSQKTGDLAVLAEFVITPLCGNFWRSRLRRKGIRCLHFKDILMKISCDFAPGCFPSP